MRRLMLSFLTVLILAPAVHADDQPTKYSIWLSPSGQEYERLNILIHQLAKEHGTPAFMPHVTVVGDLDVTFAKALKLASEIAKETYPIQTGILGFGSSHEYCRTLYLRVYANQDFLELHERTYRITGNYHTWPYHISLMYARGLTENDREKIMDGIRPPVSITLDRLRVCTSGDDPTAWTCPADVSLRK